MSNANNTSNHLVRIIAAWLVCALAFFLINNYLVYWRGASTLGDAWSGDAATPWLRGLAIVITLALSAFCVLRTPTQTLHGAANGYSSISAFIVRSAFWGVFFIGLADMTVSMLRVEGMLDTVVGDHLATQLGRPSFRGDYMHLPLLGIAMLIAFFTRGVIVVWLTALVVIAEFGIVISRFVFSYEQAYMGDLVRFWYAALFLFSSAYTLVNEGHVRVDVLYANFSERAKSKANLFGSLLLGLPLCAIILYQGMEGKGTSINAPLLSYEISQSGFGMYVKYLMAGFLAIFAITMFIQFVAIILHAIAALQDEPALADPQYEPAADNSQDYVAEQ